MVTGELLNFVGVVTNHLNLQKRTLSLMPNNVSPKLRYTLVIKSCIGRKAGDGRDRHVQRKVAALEAGELCSSPQYNQSLNGHEPWIQQPKRHPIANQPMSKTDPKNCSFHEQRLLRNPPSRKHNSLPIQRPPIPPHSLPRKPLLPNQPSRLIKSHAPPLHHPLHLSLPFPV